MMKKNYYVSIECVGEKIFQKKFWFLGNADKWALKMVRKLLICDCPATIMSNHTGEILAIVKR
jgi:hypothetical protein